jgi:predicted DNA-binding transcriptional regulator YafY
MTRGTKRSSRDAFRRRLLLLRRLMVGQQTREQLIKAAREEIHDDIYPAAPGEALKHDLNELRSQYGCEIEYRAPYYQLKSLGDLALLDLPDYTLQSLKFLEASFPGGSEVPEHANVRELIDRLLMLMTPDRVREYQTASSPQKLQVGLGTGKLDPQVLNDVRRAVRQRRELEFRYVGLRDDEPRQHRVAPYAIVTRSEGHAYLDATVLEIVPRQMDTPYQVIDYRLDRIVPGSVRILPTVLPPERRTPPRYVLHYRLVPAIARRRDVAAYFSDTVITYLPDGSAEVSAVTSNLWQARQILLRYGDGCTVTAPEELVELFRSTARGLGRNYGTPPPAGQPD